MKLRKMVRELARGVTIARRGGVRAAATFVGEEMLSNSLLRAAGALGIGAGPSGVECNLCGWRGPRFLTHCAVGYVDRGSFCPRCKSYPRHRGFAWLLRNGLGSALAPVDALEGARLVFAPEPGMLRLLSEWVSGLEGVDIAPVNEHVRYLEDLQALTFGDDTVAFVSCFHVLEHVPDDRRALRELERVLSPDGLLVLCVPMTHGRRETVDFGGPNPDMNDHCFDYGEDFVERVQEAGFGGTSYALHELVPAELHRRLAMTKEVVFLLRSRGAGRAPVVHAAEALPLVPAQDDLTGSGRGPDAGRDPGE